MKNKTSLFLTIFIISIFVIPQVTFATWWNPFSWKVFNRNPEVKTEQSIIATSTPVSTTGLEKQPLQIESFADTNEKKINTSSEQSSTKSTPKSKSSAESKTEKSSSSMDKNQESLSPKTSGSGGAWATSGPRPVTPVNCSEYKNLFDSIPNCAIYSDSSSGVDNPLYKICKQCFPTDISQPLISNIQVINITENSATITWDTNELADSKVFYATYSSSTNTFSSLLMNIFDSAYKLNQSLNLSNLVSGSIYYYEVQSKRASGNSAIRTGQFFTTP